MKKNAIGLALAMMVLTGCQGLVTRSEISQLEAKQQVQEQVNTLQKVNNDTNQRFTDLEDQMRRVTNQVEVLENAKNKSTEALEARILALENKTADLLEKNKILQEELIARSSSPANSKSEASQNGKVDHFAQAETHFAAKEWKAAILAYQKYREVSPKGKKVPEASYKIGVSFQELGMKTEAKTFYDNVISQFPNSLEAKKSQTRIKSLK
jgi:TolA-binding protein